MCGGFIEWDGSSPHADSATFVAAEGEANAQIGATYNGSGFAYTAPAAPEPTAEQVQAAADRTSGNDKLVALGLTADEISALGIA
mgnify:CR=1 FL=1